MDKFITFDTNECGYSDSKHDLLVNLFHIFSLKAKYSDIKAGNRNLWKSMSCTFADEYYNNSYNDIPTLGEMKICEVLDRIEEINIID